MSILLSKAWSVLRNYEARDLIVKRLQERHGSTASADLAREISCAFVQGREYFDSAKTADVIVKPLLLYYGVQSLARGASMFLLNMREATLAQGHGISTRQWRDVLSGDHADPWRLEVEINTNGTLPNFLQATKNTTIMRIYGPKIHAHRQHYSVTKPFQLMLGEILERLPSVANQYIRWKGDRLHLAATLLHRVENDTKMLIDVHTEQGGEQCDVSILNNWLARLNLPLINSSTSGNNIAIDREHDLCIWDVYHENYNEGVLYIVAPFSGNITLSKPVVTYILSYYLGMMVRYHPTFWISMARNERDDAAFPTLLEAVSYVETSFPLMVADYLDIDGPLSFIF